MRNIAAMRTLAYSAIFSAIINLLGNSPMTHKITANDVANGIHWIVDSKLSSIAQFVFEHR